jgi:hypothetical protein
LRNIRLFNRPWPVQWLIWLGSRCRGIRTVCGRHILLVRRRRDIRIVCRRRVYLLVRGGRLFLLPIHVGALLICGGKLAGLLWSNNLLRPGLCGLFRKRLIKLRLGIEAAIVAKVDGGIVFIDSRSLMWLFFLGRRRICFGCILRFGGRIFRF